MVALEKEKRQLTPSEISAFCAQLALIIKAGISVQEGISIMSGDVQDGRGKEVLQTILSHVEEGRTLTFALQQCGRFPKYVVDMVSIGETSGRLDEVMDSLCAYYERNETINKSIKNAVTYPMVMIGMMAVVIAVLVVKVLPIFNQVFRQLGSEMSAFSQGIMNFGAVLSRYSMWIVGFILVLLLIAVLMRRTKNGRAALSRVYDWLPFMRKLSAKIAAGRFASAMALMLSSGLDTDQSLDMAGELIENEKTKAKIVGIKQLMADGASFSNALVQMKVFSGVYASMLTVAFKTGAVDTVMKKIAQRYEEEIDTKISDIISVLEPTLVAVLSIIVGMILLSVMLPLMGIMSSIG
ncbi:type II secretion system F family protein [Hydrogenoanaerobacterium sp.]|uniref:type II secretion system F family protein n=1 Tax=Hydrogenoanaerobacterium sp. TaxID=2953763 RepID=UPI00289876BF|nr:type II secretion system F family protein [Hydrogenoanaerobacterium sp.]